MTDHQILPPEKWEDQKKQILLPALHRSQTDALLTATNASPMMPPHDLDSSAISQALSHHTSSQKSQSNNN